ncbi:unnamed protein product [Arctogadus glacialis]
MCVILRTPQDSVRVVLGLPITEAVDIWSLGCVIASLFLEEHLYPCHDEYELDELNSSLSGSVEALGKNVGQCDAVLSIQLAFIMDTHDVPSEHLINNGIRACRYFTKDQGPPNHGWRLKFYPEETEDVLMELIDLLKGLLTIDPGLRMTPRDILLRPLVSLLPEYYGHSFVSENGQPYSKESSTSSTNQLKLSPNIQTGNWSKPVSTNTRLGSLPVGLSTSQHQDQHPHYQEPEEDRQEMEKCVEEGEEDMGEVNSKDSCAEEDVGCSASQHHDQNAHYQEFGKDKEEEEENLCDTNAREEELNCHHVKDDKGGSSKGERLEEERDESASPTGGFLQIHTPG